MTPVKEQVKAIAAGAGAGLASIATALVDGQITALEWVGAAVLAVAAYQAVFWTPQPAPLPTLTAAELRGMADRAARREREAPR
jgi:hypothetical protein